MHSIVTYVSFRSLLAANGALHPLLLLLLLLVLPTLDTGGC